MNGTNCNDDERGLRHTFCTNLANAGMNPKALQYIMGHSNINMTLNYYAHAIHVSAFKGSRKSSKIF
jgi:integrase